jgi:hypothetical protein
LFLVSASGQKHQSRWNNAAAKSVDMVCLVFSIASKQSFRDLQNNIYPLIRRSFGSRVKYLLVGTCADATKVTRSAVSRTKALAFADKIGNCRYITTSALNTLNTDVFMGYTITRAVEASLLGKQRTPLRKFIELHSMIITMALAFVLYMIILLW